MSSKNNKFIKMDISSVAIDKIPTPLSWEVKYPVIKGEKLEVKLKVWLHGGGEPRSTFFTFTFEKDFFKKDIDSFLKKTQSPPGADNKFLRVQELGKLKAKRDDRFIRAKLKLADSLGSVCTAKKTAEAAIFQDEECAILFVDLVRLETLLNLLNKEKCFQSEEMQAALFA